MRLSQRVHDPAPNASPTPANETVVAGGIWAEAAGQIAPWCSRSQDPEDAVEDTPIVRPWYATRFVRQHRLDGHPFVVGEFIAHDSSPQFGGFESRSTAGLNRSSEIHKGRLSGRDFLNHARLRRLVLASISHDTTSNASYFLSTISGRTARAFAIALSFAVDSSAANIFRTCSSPVADRRSLTENTVLRPICCSFSMHLRL